jgi:hypothetical protein
MKLGTLKNIKCSSLIYTEFLSPSGFPVRGKNKVQVGFPNLINKVRVSMFKFAVHMSFLTNN